MLIGQGMDDGGRRNAQQMAGGPRSRLGHLLLKDHLDKTGFQIFQTFCYLRDSGWQNVTGRSSPAPHLAPLFQPRPLLLLLATPLPAVAGDDQLGSVLQPVLHVDLLLAQGVEEVPGHGRDVGGRGGARRGRDVGGRLHVRLQDLEQV